MIANAQAHWFATKVHALILVCGGNNQAQNVKNAWKTKKKTQESQFRIPLIFILNSVLTSGMTARRKLKIATRAKKGKEVGDGD
jgi:hypothetical protein